MSDETKPDETAPVDPFDREVAPGVTPRKCFENFGTDGGALYKQYRLQVRAALQPPPSRGRGVVILQREDLESLASATAALRGGDLAAYKALRVKLGLGNN